MKPVAAVQHSVGGGAGSVQTSSLKTATGTVSASSAVNRHKRPLPLHINISHSSALVSSFPRCSSNIATVIVYLYMPAIGFDFNSSGSEWPHCADVLAHFSELPDYFVSILHRNTCLIVSHSIYVI